VVLVNVFGSFVAKPASTERAGERAQTLINAAHGIILIKNMPSLSILRHSMQAGGGAQFQRARFDSRFYHKGI
jgi:hypothetical protein